MRSLQRSSCARRVSRYSGPRRPRTASAAYLVAKMLGKRVEMMRKTYGHLVPPMVEEQAARLDAVCSRNRHHSGTTGGSARRRGMKKPLSRKGPFVETRRFELLTSCLQSRRSTS